MNLKITLILLLLSSMTYQKSYKDNEELYQKYDPSFSNENFHIRPIEELKGRTDFLNGLDCSMVSVIEENGGR